MSTIAAAFAPRQRQPRAESDEHLAFVRSQPCAVLGPKCYGRIEPHHTTTRGAGGGDESCAPLCTKHHADGHKMGWASFQRLHAVSLKSIADDLWAISPARKRSQP